MQFTPSIIYEYKTITASSHWGHMRYFMMLLLYIGVCLAVGLNAKRLNRNGIAWFLWSLFVLTPFISAPCLVLLGRRRILIA